MTETTTCDSCGEPVTTGAQFCTSCGTYLEWGGASAATPAPSAGVPSAPAPSAPPSYPPPPSAPPPTLPAQFGPGPSGPAPYGTAPYAPAPYPPAAVATQPPVAAGIRCPECGLDNAAGRRFCARCGHFVGTPSADAHRPPPPVPQRTWWQRLLRRDPSVDRATRKAYRKSLPLSVRLRRLLIPLGVLVLVGVFLKLAGHDPIAWARQQVYAIRGTLTDVGGVTAVADPPSATVAQFGADQAVDHHPDTAWATNFAFGTKAPPTKCTPAGEGSLQLTAPKKVTLRGLKLHAGLAADDQDRMLQWRPKTLDLAFSNGSCQRVQVKDVPDWQTVRISAVSTYAVRVTVVAGYPPDVALPTKLVAISEVELLVRPH